MLWVSICPRLAPGSRTRPPGGLRSSKSSAAPSLARRLVRSINQTAAEAERDLAGVLPGLHGLQPRPLLFWLAGHVVREVQHLVSPQVDDPLSPSSPAACRPLLWPRCSVPPACQRTDLLPSPWRVGQAQLYPPRLSRAHPHPSDSSVRCESHGDCAPDPDHWRQPARSARIAPAAPCRSDGEFATSATAVLPALDEPAPGRRGLTPKCA